MLLDGFARSIVGCRPEGGIGSGEVGRGRERVPLGRLAIGVHQGVAEGGRRLGLARARLGRRAGRGCLLRRGRIALGFLARRIGRRVALLLRRRAVEHGAADGSARAFLPPFLAAFLARLFAALVPRIFARADALVLFLRRLRCRRRGAQVVAISRFEDRPPIDIPSPLLRFVDRQHRGHLDRARQPLRQRAERRLGRHRRLVLHPGRLGPGSRQTAPLALGFLAHRQRHPVCLRAVPDLLDLGPGHHAEGMPVRQARHRVGEQDLLAPPHRAMAQEGVRAHREVEIVAVHHDRGVDRLHQRRAVGQFQQARISEDDLHLDPVILPLARRRVVFRPLERDQVQMLHRRVRFEAALRRRQEAADQVAHGRLPQQRRLPPGSDHGPQHPVGRHVARQRFRDPLAELEVAVQVIEVFDLAQRLVRQVGDRRGGEAARPFGRPHRRAGGRDVLAHRRRSFCWW